MSGKAKKAEKAAGKQRPQDSTGASSASQVASLDAQNVSGYEPSVTLPGHYLPVGSQPVSPVTAGSLRERIPAASADIAHPFIPQTDDVVALSVRAVTDKGFWRCGRFWPREPVHVFASDDPDADNAANNEYCNMVLNCFISHADAARLKAEPMLVVTLLDTVAEQQ